MSKQFSLLAAAVSYARLGWHVFPLHTPLPDQSPPCSCGNLKCEQPGKHPREKGWQQSATTVEAVIKRWWGQWPEANIGLVTGPANGLWVLDVDQRHDGLDTLGALWDEDDRGADWPTTVRQTTGSGSFHYFFTWTGEVAQKVGFRPGLDTRAAGGLVVLPPSLHLSGQRYRWTPGLRPHVQPIAPAPDWLIALVNESSKKKTSAAVASVQFHQGTRDDRLASVAGTMRRRGLEEPEIAAALLTINARRCIPPLSDEQVHKIAGSICNYQPAQLAPQYLNGTAPPEDGEAPALEIELAACRTDLGNAVRLVRRHGERLRHAYGQGWMSWSGSHWAPDRLEDVLNYAKETARSVLAEAEACPDKDESKKLAAWSFSSRSAGRVHAMLDLAKSEPDVRCAIEDFDQDLYLFNCANGALDLRTGTLKPHRREDLISQVSPVEYDPRARFDPWNEFLAELTGGDEQFAGFLQRAVGLSLSGDVSDSALFFALGPTGTGKSTVLAAIAAAMGSYASSAAFETFLVRDRVGAPRPDLARLRGKRLVTSVETEQGRRFASGLMKQLSGDDMLVCRFLHVNEIEYRPQFKLWLAANDAPEAPHDDEGFWRRLYRLPFVHRPQHPNAKLKVRLRQPDAGAAILAWAVAGFREWQQQGLGLPEAIRAATAEYRDTMDPLAGLFPDYLRIDQEERATADQIKEAYWKFVHDNDIREPLSTKKLLKIIADRGPRLVHTEKGNHWRGVGVVTRSLFGSG